VKYTNVLFLISSFLATLNSYCQVGYEVFNSGIQNELDFITAEWIWDSSIFSSIKPILDMGLFVDFCVFTCFYQFLHDVLIKLFCFGMQNNFVSTSCKNPVKTGKYTEINKQSNVKFWLNWIKYGAVSYSLSCNEMNGLQGNFVNWQTAR
jgi:hypothetical protein